MVQSTISFLKQDIKRLESREKELLSYLRRLPPAMAFEHYEGNHELGELRRLREGKEERLKAVQRAWQRQDFDELLRLGIPGRM